MIRSVRFSLTIWYAGILAVILCVFGALLYTSVKTNLFHTVDSLLAAEADGVGDAAAKTADTSGDVAYFEAARGAAMDVALRDASTEPSPAPCATSADCPQYHFCEIDHCGPTPGGRCLWASYCGPGYVCGPGQACECAGGLVCIAGADGYRCRILCADNPGCTCDSAGCDGLMVCR